MIYDLILANSLGLTSKSYFGRHYIYIVAALDFRNWRASVGLTSLRSYQNNERTFLVLFILTPI